MNSKIVSLQRSTRSGYDHGVPPLESVNVSENSPIDHVQCSECVVICDKSPHSFTSTSMKLTIAGTQPINRKTRLVLVPLRAHPTSQDPTALPLVLFSRLDRTFITSARTCTRVIEKLPPFGTSPCNSSQSNDHKMSFNSIDPREPSD